MYDKISKNYCMAFMSVIFVSLIFNLFIRNEADFSYLIIDVNDVGNTILQNNKNVVGYILLKRIKQLALLLIILKAFGYQIVFDFMVIVGGCAIGLMVSSQVYYLGLAGLIILLVYVFPHYIVYFYGLYFGYKNKIFSVGKTDNFKIFVIFSLVFIVGMILESIFMTIFLKNFYQYMVT